ncbi:MAG: hypothetical protein EXQ52_04390 [Bryobacterales bacterium]|nr:hypothetical protein [Bryobacterales bacterium]
MKWLIFVLTSLAWAQSSIEPPRAGIVRGADNKVRPIHGVPGNFLAPLPDGEEALGYAFSGRFALRKTGNEILTLDADGKIIARLPAPAGPALFAFHPTGEPAIAWLPDIREMWRLGPVHDRVPFESDGDIFSIGPGEDGAIRVNDFPVKFVERPKRIQQMSERLFHVLTAEGKSLSVRAATGAVWELPAEEVTR